MNRLPSILALAVLSLILTGVGKYTYDRETRDVLPNPDPSTQPARYAWVDAFIDPHGQALAAYQFELKSSGGGAVSVTCNGKYEFLKVVIRDDAMGDKDMLEDLFLAALQDASNKVTEAMEQKMAKITAGLNIPGFKLPGF